MRRKLAAVALAAGLFAVAGCSDDGGASTEDVCNDIEGTADPLEGDLQTALQQAGMAAAQGDDAALAEAMVEVDSLLGEVTGAVRDGAEEAEDEEFSQALETWADELESLVSQVASGETAPDMSGLDAASDQVSQYCDA